MDDQDFVASSGFSAEKRELLQALLAEEGIDLDQEQLVIPRREHSVDVPLSFAQQRLWFMDQWEPESSLYNVQIVLQFQGCVQLATLEACFNEIVQRHEILRTTFVQTDGKPFQLILPSVSISLEVCDLGVLSANWREQEVQRLLREEGQRSFDLAVGPLLRIRLLRWYPEACIFSLTMHHIITDGWSISTLLTELSELYQAYSQGQPSPLPVLAIQYADYSCWQRGWLQGKRLQDQLSYWQQQLAGLPEQLKLPTDYPRPAIQRYRGAISDFNLSTGLSEKLQALCQREEVTLFMLLLAAFQVLLYRYSGQEDIVVGSPIANRTRQEIEPLVGFFANTLVLRSRVLARSNFRTLLQQVKEVTLGAYTHQDLPFEILVENLAPARNMSFHPLFQVMFTLQTAFPFKLLLGNASGTFLEKYVERVSSQFDITLDVKENKKGLYGIWEYNSDLFSLTTIEHMSACFQNILQKLIQNIDTAIYDFPILTEQELQERVAWNTTDRHYPQASCLLHELVEAQVERTPDATAVCIDEGVLSYHHLNERANQLAHWLRRQGVGPEVRVGICMERSLDLVVSLLAVLKAGGAYLPLDPDYPAERLNYLLHDAQISLLLTQDLLRLRLPAYEKPLLAVDSAWDWLSQEDRSNPAVKIALENLAYVIYTSGSTGLPKGAMNSHLGIVNRLLWMQDTYQLQPTDRLLQKASSSFDVSVCEFFWPLLSGAQLILARPGGQRDPHYLIDVMGREEITVVHFVPSTLSIFLETPGVEHCRSLRLLTSSGEALPVEVQWRCHERLKAVALHNLYGPTEVAVDVTAWACVHEEHEHNAPISVPIGQPIANIQIHILDSYMQPVPQGVIGELYIGGAGVGRGYLFRPDLTAERFVPSPFNAHLGERLYRTGDLARFRIGGVIEYIGRNDTQIKVRGYRVELGEVEAVLGQHAAIRDCAVIAHGDRLIGYVALNAQNPQQMVTPKDLLQWLRARLPEYMIPARLVMLEMLPLTPSGKLDRRALPTIEEIEPTRDLPFEGPRTPVEERVAEIWKAVLGVKRVSISDNFFELGGHSLLATQVILRVGKAFNTDISLRAIFEKPVFAEFVEFVHQAQQRRWEEMLVKLDALSEEEVESLLQEQQSSEI